MIIENRSAKRKLIRTVIAAIVLLVIAIVVAVTYAWMSGKEEVVADFPSPKKTTQRQTSKDVQRKPDPNSNAFAAREYFTTPVTPGMNAMITIKTVATSKCTIKVLYNNVASTDSGLQDKVADELGNVSWSWTVPADAPEGSWPVDMTCYFMDKSAFLRENLVVKKDISQ